MKAAYTTHTIFFVALLGSSALQTGFKKSRFIGIAGIPLSLKRNIFMLDVNPCEFGVGLYE